MPELTPQDFENSFSDDADLAAVKFYLSIGDDDTQLRVSIAMYAGAGNDDPEKITKDAEELRLGSIGTASRLRENLLLAMNFETLILLLSQIGYNLEMLAQGRQITGKYSPSGKSEIKDPIKGPVFAMIKRRLPGLPDAPERQRQLGIDTAIETASTRTKVPYPGTPCELEPALRWAADAPDVPFKTLRRAFLNFLETHVPDGVTDSLNEELAEYTEQLKRARGDSTRTHELSREIKAIQERLTFLKTINSHRTSFKPGKTDAPKKVAAHAKKLLETAWDRSNPVVVKSTLADLSTTFYPFWIKHSRAYQKRAKEISSKNKGSAPDGPISKMRPVWAAHTEAFIRFSEGRVIPNTGSDEWNELFKEFAKSLPEPKDPRAQKKVAAFMKTLLVRAPQAISDAEITDIIKLLNAEGIKAVDHATIRSCLEKLKMVIFPAPTKTDAKPTDQSI